MTTSFDGVTLGSSMTPELRQSVATRARALQDRLNRRALGAAEAAAEARRLFEDAADDVRTRWLTLELGGYAGHVDAAPLHRVLRVPAGDRLVAHVAAYRTQDGVDATPERGRQPFRHFFVESLAALEAARARVAKTGDTGPLVLDFGASSAAGHPVTGEFTRGLFDRVLEGFLAALHLQLGSLST